MGWWKQAQNWLRAGVRESAGPKIGLALGGGFARGIAHIGVLRVLEQNKIPIRAIAGVSSGSIVAAAFASGTSADEIEKVALSMKFRDVARWTLNLRGLAGNDRMVKFLARLLKVTRFEDMKIPLAIVATDLRRGKPVTFRDKGDVIFPIRASCAYPGLFLPVRHAGKLLVDGFVSMEVPADPVRAMGSDRVISVAIPASDGIEDYGNMFSVVSRCFQVMSMRTENSWRRHSSLVISPAANGLTWNSFADAKKLIELGEQAALAAIPAINKWLGASTESSVAKAESLPLTA